MYPWVLGIVSSPDSSFPLIVLLHVPDTPYEHITATSLHTRCTSIHYIHCKPLYLYSMLYPAQTAPFQPTLTPAAAPVFFRPSESLITLPSRGWLGGDKPLWSLLHTAKAYLVSTLATSDCAPFFQSPDSQRRLLQFRSISR